MTRLWARLCDWICQRRSLRVATPAVQELTRQTDEAKAELARQRVGTQRESRLRQRALAELDLELRLLRLGKGKGR